ncbi:MAG TPA: FAD binding domain-containing protein [Thermoanaerobaculia bacterium]|nr:FAD binding domain-containing protein [Thermoanaerobaculia bacterium]
MKPAPFAYRAPRSLPEGLDELARHGGECKVLAGGQSLIPVMTFRLAQPALLVDVNGLRELDFVTATGDGGLRLGALVRQRRLEREREVARRAPLLAEALPHVAHPQIRNRGTLGGSLAHADPAAELPAVAVALAARLRLERAGGSRWVPAGEFFHGLFATALAEDELLVEIELPPLPPRTGCAFLEVARRHGDYAQVGVAAVLTLDESGRCAAARLVFLSVGDAPMTADGAAALLLGEAPAGEAIAAAADHAARREIDPVDDIHASADFKRHLARVLADRVLRRAAARAAGGEDGG